MAGALFCAAGAISVQAANSSLVTFSVDMSTNVVLGTFVPGTDTVAARGTFNSFGTFNLVQDTSQPVGVYIYTNTVNDTSDANGAVLSYKYWDSNLSSVGWENTADGQNRAALLPASSGASLVLPTVYFSDAGAPVTQDVKFQVDVSEQVVLGNFVPGTSSVEVRGTFNSWAGGANPLVNDTSTTVPGEPGFPLWTNSITTSYSPNAQMAFKYVIQPGTVWDSPSAPNSDAGGNRFFNAVSQTLPLVNFADAKYVAATCTNVLTVNMSGPAKYDASFNASSVTVNGQFNGWGAAVPMVATADPTIYTSSVPIVFGQGQTFQYQYRYQNAGGTVYDHFNGLNGGGGNRNLAEPNQNNYNPPSVNFNDAGVDDYLANPVNVTFEIVMKTGDVGNLGHPTWAPGAAVFVNGVFNNWANWDPITLAPYQLVEYPINGSSSLYSNQVTIPAGNLTSTIYKYGMADGGNTVDNEAGSGANVLRVIRTTGPGAGGAYVFSVDSWANMYQEPSFGQLTIDKPNVDGLVPISWLGRPSVQVQSSPSLTSPTWTSYKITDGTNWVNGVSSTNGLVSKWADIPGGQSQKFYRLIKN